MSIELNKKIKILGLIDQSNSNLVELINDNGTVKYLHNTNKKIPLGGLIETVIPTSSDIPSGKVSLYVDGSTLKGKKSDGESISIGGSGSGDITGSGENGEFAVFGGEKIVTSSNLLKIGGSGIEVINDDNKNFGITTNGNLLLQNGVNEVTPHSNERDIALWNNGGVLQVDVKFSGVYSPLASSIRIKNIMLRPSNDIGDNTIYCDDGGGIRYNRNGNDNFFIPSIGITSVVNYRVPYIKTSLSGNMETSTNFTFNSSTNTLNATNITQNGKNIPSIDNYNSTSISSIPTIDTTTKKISQIPTSNLRWVGSLNKLEILNNGYFFQGGEMVTTWSTSLPNVPSDTFTIPFIETSSTKSQLKYSPIKYSPYTTGKTTETVSIDNFEHPLVFNVGEDGLPTTCNIFGSTYIKRDSDSVLQLVPSISSTDIKNEGSLIYHKDTTGVITSSQNVFINEDLELSTLNNVNIGGKINFNATDICLQSSIAKTSIKVGNNIEEKKISTINDNVLNSVSIMNDTIITRSNAFQRNLQDINGDLVTATSIIVDGATTITKSVSKGSYSEIGFNLLSVSSGSLLCDLPVSKNSLLLFEISYITFTSDTTLPERKGGAGISRFAVAVNNSGVGRTMPDDNTIVFKDNPLYACAVSYDCTTPYHIKIRTNTSTYTNVHYTGIIKITELLSSVIV